MAELTEILLTGIYGSIGLVGVVVVRGVCRGRVRRMRGLV